MATFSGRRTPAVNFDSFWKFQNEIGDQKSKASKMVVELNTLLETSRKQVVDAGLSREAAHFKVEADKNANFSVGWLILTGIIAAGICLYAYFHINNEATNLPIDTPTRRLIALAVPRIIIISAIWFALVLCARNYTACRHNVVVNRHRQNALATFQTFTSVQTDQQTKDAILLQATQCIFAPQTSGYLKGESDPGGNQVLEIIRALPTGRGAPSGNVT